MSHLKKEENELYDYGSKLFNFGNPDKIKPPSDEKPSSEEEPPLNSKFLEGFERTSLENFDQSMKKFLDKKDTPSP